MSRHDRKRFRAVPAVVGHATVVRVVVRIGVSDARRGVERSGTVTTLRTGPAATVPFAEMLRGHEKV